MHVIVIFGLTNKSTKPSSPNGPATEFQKSVAFEFAIRKKKHEKKTCQGEILKKLYNNNLRLESKLAYTTVVTIKKKY